MPAAKHRRRGPVKACGHHGLFRPRDRRRTRAQPGKYQRLASRILIVEDNELNLKLFCDLLRAHGFAVEPVRDGREALDRARAFAPDLVVMDIQMPHISGLELIERFKADPALAAAPVLAVTAYAARGDEERIRDAGAEGYVSKPISVARFVEAVRALLPRTEDEERAVG